MDYSIILSLVLHSFQRRVVNEFVLFVVVIHEVWWRERRNYRETSMYQCRGTTTTLQQ
jgi:hypothetical protein